MGEMFDDWWRQYPRKTAKHAARKEWDKLSEEEQARALAVMPLQVKAWRGKDTQYIPHGRTWLHQKRYLDDEFEAPQTESDKWLEALYGHGNGSAATVRRVSEMLGGAGDGASVAGRYIAERD